jgi:hypothetical protein
MRNLSRNAFYRVATAVILVGFAMLIQPLSMFLFSWGLPVMLAGIALHIVLDHLPDAKPRDDRAAPAREGSP